MGNGYVYILEVSDIDLPVCKIGRTSASPHDRCRQINRSSTGDFLWKVAYEFPVNDCKAFERIVHKKLEPLRQKNREFFNVTAEVACEAVQSILAKHSEICAIPVEEIVEKPEKDVLATPKKTRRPRPHPFNQRDSEYVDFLSVFTKVTHCKGRPFGQLNKPYFGMSDGNEGLQWNVVVYRDAEQARLGVNLEGKQYGDWPIVNFLLSELEDPKLFEVREAISKPDQVYLRIMRDAWQVTSRPSILERFIGCGDILLAQIGHNKWHSMLEEALQCLSSERGHRGRAEQLVTLKNQPKKGERKRVMQVSPHLMVWTPVKSIGQIEENLRLGVELLTPIYNWVYHASQS